MISRRTLLLSTAGASAGFVVGCGGAESSSKYPGGIVAWTGPLKNLFNDTINPAAVGMSLSGRAPHKDPLIKYRARAADVVARMRVQTITRDQMGAKRRYTLNMQVGHPTLLRPKVATVNFQLAIRSGTAAFGLVSRLENTLRGRIFIGFVRRFLGPGGAGQDIHWHLTANTTEVARVIQEVAALGELSAS